MTLTPSQTVGPYFRIGLLREEWSQLAAGAESTITIRGRVWDSEGAPVLDAMLEIWQPEQQRFGRIETDPQTGRFEIVASTPRPVKQPDGSAQAPHLVVGVFARGLLRRLYTRMYLADEALNAGDPILALIPPERRGTVLAQPTAAAAGKEYRLDIRLSGPDETVFFEC